MVPLFVQQLGQSPAVILGFDHSAAVLVLQGAAMSAVWAGPLWQQNSLIPCIGLILGEWFAGAALALLH